MAELVNLRQQRKARARAAKEEAAARNRALHGRSKAERQRDSKSAEAVRRHLDAHRLDPVSGPRTDGE